MQLGALSTTEISGPKDYFLLTVPNVNIAAGAISYFTVGSIVMPFTGAIVADFYVRSYLDSQNNYLRPRLVSSTPAPSAYSNHAIWPTVDTVVAYNETPMTAAWNSVAKGTTVTFTAAIDAGPHKSFLIIVIGGIVHTCQP